MIKKQEQETNNNATKVHRLVKQGRKYPVCYILSQSKMLQLYYAPQALYNIYTSLFAWQAAYIIKKAIRYGYLPRSFCALGELSEDSDDKLFFSTRYNPNHILHRLLPQPRNTQYHLRHRTHGLILPTDVNAASKKNSLYRMLFSDIY